VTFKGKLVLLMLLSILLISPSMAESLTLDLGNANGSFSGRMIQLFLIFSVLSVAPSLIIMVTSFTRIIVVLSFLRNSMGLQQSPPNMVLISLAMFLTVFVMEPTFEKAYQQGVVPLIEEKIKEEEAVEKCVQPFKEFMLSNVREQDLRLFMDLAKVGSVHEPSATPLKFSCQLL